MTDEKITKSRKVGVNAVNSVVHQSSTCEASNRPKVDIEAQNAILKNMAGMSLRAYSRTIEANAGYLSAVLKGTRPASNTLRVKLGLPPNAVTVAPLPCGCPPQGTRCKVHGKPTKYAPHPVKRLTAIRKLLQNPYLQS